MFFSFCMTGPAGDQLVTEAKIGWEKLAFCSSSKHTVPKLSPQDSLAPPTTRNSEVKKDMHNPFYYQLIFLLIPQILFLCTVVS